MIKAIIFDCFGVLYVPGLLGRLERNHELLDFIQSLRSAYKIGLLSNISLQTLGAYLGPTDQKRFFDDIVIPSEAGMAKPHSGIFALAAKRLNVDPTECLLVDDSADNCRGAHLIGMQVIEFVATEQVIQDITQRLALNK